MNTDRLNALLPSWRGGATRRDLTRALSGALLAAPLASLLGTSGGEAKKKKGKKKKKCKPQPVATTCAGKCGPVKNNCKNAVSCTCPTGACCSGNGTCGACLVFVTSSSHDGNLGGLEGADDICQDLAEAAALPGEYRAWLSDSTGSPSTRFVRATVPYTLIDGTPIASSWSDLTDGALAHGISLTEQGEDAGSLNVWTNTLIAGTPGGFEPDGHCVNWTSSGLAPMFNGNTGRSSVTTATWTRFSDHGCDEPWQHYCFQQH